MEEQFTEILPYNELTKTYSREEISYPLLLRTTEWRDFRKKIMERDLFRCCNCKNFGTEVTDGKLFVAVERDTTWAFINGIEKEVVMSEEFFLQERYYQMQVHHKYYVRGKLPWEYDVKALQTVCHYCHKEIHQKGPIPVYELDGGVNYEYTFECRKCDGIGYIPRYSHVKNGVYFACMGDGFIGVY